MKKRAFAVLLLLCLCAAFLLPFASATNDLFFVAFNDTIPLTLSGDEKPYSSATGLYVPYTVFNAAPGGVAVSYNAAAQTLVLFSTQKTLTINISKGTCTDETGKVTDILTTFKSGRLYIPLNFCTAHFGLSYSILTSQGGYTVLRFTNGRQAYDNGEFLEKAENLIAYRVESIRNGQNPDANTADADDSEPEQKSSVCFLICGASQMESAMEELKKRGANAAFFLTAEELREHPDLVRSLYVQGNVIGLTLAADAQNPAAELREANEQLDAILHYKTLLALVTSEQKALLSGYYTYEKPAYAQSIETALRSKTQTVYVCEKNAAQDLRAAGQADAVLTLLRENTRS